MLVAPPPPADPKTAKVVKRLSAPKFNGDDLPALFPPTGDINTVPQMFAATPPPAAGGADASAPVSPMVPPPPESTMAPTDSVDPEDALKAKLAAAIQTVGTSTPVGQDAPTNPTFVPPPSRNEAQEKSERQKRGVLGLVALGLAALFHGGPGALQGVAQGTNQGIQNLQSRQDESFGERLHNADQSNAQAQQSFGNQEKTYQDAVARAHYTDAQNQDMVENIAAQIKAEQDAGKSDTNSKQKMLDYWSKLTPESQKSLQPLLGALGYDSLPIGIATQKDLTASERAGTGAANAAERGRHNLATEGIQTGTLQERIRNNKQLAGIHQEVADTTHWMDQARINHMKATENLARAAQQARLTGNPLALQRLQVQGAQQQRLLRQEQEAYGAKAASISLRIAALHATPTGDDEADKDTLSKLTDAYYQAKQNIEYSKQEQEQLAQQLAPPITVPPGAGAVSNNGNLPSVGPIGIPPPPNGNSSFFTNAGPIGDNTVTTRPGTPAPKKIELPPTGKKVSARSASPGITLKAKSGRSYQVIP